MARDISMQGTIALTAAELLWLMTNPNEVATQARAMGASRVVVTETKGQEGTLNLEIQREEPSWHGGEQKRAVFIQSWDLRHSSCRWRRQDLERPNLVQVEGVVHISPLGHEHCELREEVHIEVRIPLFGRRIEALIARDLLAKQQRVRAYWQGRKKAIPDRDNSPLSGTVPSYIRS